MKGRRVKYKKEQGAKVLSLLLVPFILDLKENPCSKN